MGCSQRSRFYHVRIAVTLLAVSIWPRSVTVLSACGDKSGSVPEVPEEELTASVPELRQFTSSWNPSGTMRFPAKDFDPIQELVPQFEPTLAALDAVELPGILQDKQASGTRERWPRRTASEGLKTAAETGNEEEMLGYAETFHMSYEGLVRYHPTAPPGAGGGPSAPLRALPLLRPRV